ncbi:hypothetical protein FSP39_010775 [Pinctada imbricata]|uniref:Uncharacterized protein n=1 Tax=Pinctada imbricata TaxID=66713 RepID=A0AA88YCU9_PINIB|nr:hypothetical protein FSP39_010775 [Pinctada imbricata]
MLPAEPPKFGEFKHNDVSDHSGTQAHETKIKELYIKQTRELTDSDKSHQNDQNQCTCLFTDEINTDEHCSIPTTLPPSPSLDVPSTSMSEDNWSSFHEITSWTHHSSMMEQTVSMHSSVFSSLDSSDLSTGVIQDLESTRPLEITPTVAKSIIPTISTDVYPYSSDNSLEYSTSLEDSISLESSMSLSSPLFETNFGSSAETSVSELSVSKTLMAGNHRSEYSTLLLSSNPFIDFSVTSESTHVTLRTEHSSDTSLIFESSYHTSIMTEHSKYFSSSVISSSHSPSSSMPISKTSLSILPSLSTENMDVLRATSPVIILDSASSESQETAHFKNTYVPDLSTTTVTPHFDKDAFEKVLEDLRVKKRTKQVAKEAPGGETIGAVAMVILFVIFAGVVLLDLSTIQNHFKLFLRNIKGCRERKEEQNQIELTSL